MDHTQRGRGLVSDACSKCSASVLHVRTGHTPSNPSLYRSHHRYALLPYLYTLFLHANGTGAPIMRPLFYEFPAEPAAAAVQHSFMLGEAGRGRQSRVGCAAVPGVRLCRVRARLHGAQCSNPAAHAH